MSYPVTTNYRNWSVGDSRRTGTSIASKYYFCVRTVFCDVLCASERGINVEFCLSNFDY